MLVIRLIGYCGVFVGVLVFGCFCDGWLNSVAFMVSSIIWVFDLCLLICLIWFDLYWLVCVGKGDCFSV